MTFTNREELPGRPPTRLTLCFASNPSRLEFRADPVAPQHSPGSGRYHPSARPEGIASPRSRLVELFPAASLLHSHAIHRHYSSDSVAARSTYLSPSNSRGSL